MRVAERVPVTFLELDWTEVRWLPHLKRTAPGFVWKQTDTTSLGLGLAFWSAPEFDGLYSHQTKRSAPGIFWV